MLAKFLHGGAERNTQKCALSKTLVQNTLVLCLSVCYMTFGTLKHQRPILLGLGVCQDAPGHQGGRCSIAHACGAPARCLGGT